MWQRLTEWRLSQQSRLRLTAAATIACDAVFSYVSTRNLAERFGFGWLSWLFPLCLDATAAVGMELWLSRSRAQVAAMWLALSAIALSLAANVVDWRLAQNNWGSAVLGGVPPAMLAAQLLVLHIGSARTGRPATRTSRRAHPRTRRAPGPKPRVPDPELLEVLRQFELKNGRLSKRQLMTEFGVGDPRARRLLKQLHPAAPTHTNGAALR